MDGSTLGVNALCAYRVVLDGPNEKLSLLEDESPPIGDQWVPFEGIFGSIHQTILATTPNGKQARVFLDTGMNFSRASKSLLVKDTDETISILVGGSSIEAKPKDLLDGPERVFEFSDATSNKRMETDCALGWDVLKHYRFEISFRYKKLRIVP